MKRNTTGTFIAQSNGIAIDDVIAFDGAPPFAGWTPGCVAMTQAFPATSKDNQHWSILSVSVQGLLALSMTSSAGQAGMGGKLGGIIAGLLTIPGNLDYPVHGAGTTPYVNPIVDLPTDQTLVGSMWDPATDPLPPIVTGNPALIGPSGYLPISTVISPPVPIDMDPGINPIIGIWMKPSLLCSLIGNGLGGGGLFGVNLNYTVNYDDGL